MAQRTSAFEHYQVAPTLALQTIASLPTEVVAVPRSSAFEHYQAAPTPAPQTTAFPPMELATAQRTSAPTPAPRTIASSPTEVVAVPRSSAFEHYQAAPLTTPQTIAVTTSLPYQVTPTTFLPPVTTLKQLDKGTALSSAQSIQHDSTAVVEKCWMDLRNAQTESKQLSQTLQTCQNETQIAIWEISNCTAKRQKQDDDIIDLVKEKDAEVAKFLGCDEALKDRVALHNAAQSNAAAEKRMRVACTQARDTTLVDLGFANANLSNVITQLEIRNGEVQKLSGDLDSCHSQQTEEKTRRDAKEGELGICKADKTKVEDRLRSALLSYKTLNTTTGYCCSVKADLNFSLAETRTELQACQNNLQEAKEDSRELSVTKSALKAAEHLAASYKEVSKNCDVSRLSCTRDLFGNTTTLRTCQQEFANVSRSHSHLYQNLSIALDDLSIAAASLNESSKMLQHCEKQRDSMKAKKDEFFDKLQDCKQDILCECSQMSSLQEQLDQIKLAKEDAEVANLALKDQLLLCRSSKDEINMDKHNLTVSLAKVIRNDNSSILTDDKTARIWMAMTYVFGILFWVAFVFCCFLAKDKRRLHQEKVELIEKIRHVSLQSRELSLALNSPSATAATLAGVMAAIPISSTRGSDESLR